MLLNIEPDIYNVAVLNDIILAGSFYFAVSPTVSAASWSAAYTPNGLDVVGNDL